MEDFVLQSKVNALKHLFADDDKGGDFIMPSSLKEVPSFTSENSGQLPTGVLYAELGRRSPGNK